MILGSELYVTWIDFALLPKITIGFALPYVAEAPQPRRHNLSHARLEAHKRNNPQNL